MKRIGLLTSGGDCSGLNAAIRAVVSSALERGWEVFGIHDATNGLILRPLSYHQMTMKDFEFPFATLGGTMLGTTNQADPHTFLKNDGTTEKLTDEEIMARFKEGLKLEALVVIGGDGSMSIVSHYCQGTGVKMVGIPKTMDNDAPGTDLAIGFQTATQVVTDALDKLDTTAASHHRVMIAEVMGRGAGHLALQAAKIFPRTLKPSSLKRFTKYPEMPLKVCPLMAFEVSPIGDLIPSATTIKAWLRPSSLMVFNFFKIPS